MKCKDFNLRRSHHQYPAHHIVIFIRLTVNDNWTGNNSSRVLVDNIGFGVVKSINIKKFGKFALNQNHTYFDI